MEIAAPQRPESVRVLAGSVYPQMAASTRLRVGLLREPLARRGATLREWTFLRDGDLDGWIGGDRGRVVPSLRGPMEARRWDALARSASVVVVQRELLPWNTTALERRVVRRCPMVWDVDDSMWNASVGLRARFRGSQAKYEWLARSASEIWSGSETVAAWCADRGAENVLVVPTVTPLPTVVGTPTDPRRLVWVGSPTTGPFVERLLRDNRADFVDWIVEIVGAKCAPVPGLRIETYEWTQENEARALSRAWAGLYPIDTTNVFTLGKSALKAVLMGAYGLPVIATRTPSNAAVIEDGTTGFLVEDEGDWSSALKEVADPIVRDRLGAAGRARIERDYNPAIWGDRLAVSLLRLSGMPESDVGY